MIKKLIKNFVQDAAYDDLSSGLFGRSLLFHFIARGRASQVHVRPVRKQLDAVHHEVPHGRVHDQTQLQVLRFYLYRSYL